MNTIALLGAGFSKNWGGLLAIDVREDLVSRLAHTAPDLVDRLRTGPNYEDLLAQIQSEHATQNTPATRARLQNLQDAISAAFDAMNRAFEAAHFELSNAVQYSIRQFLSRFDAIFTTNQDLLLELHYNSVELFNNPERPVRWQGWYLPGVTPPPNGGLMAPNWEKLIAIWHPTNNFQLIPASQPVFKLHGSTRWRAQDGTDLMIVGRNKDAQIAQIQILSWYFEQFGLYLMKPDTRIMAIGYSFSDRHIDQAIADAYAANQQIGIFYFGPRGRNVLNKNPPGTIPNDHDHVCYNVRLLGENTHDLRQTFSTDHMAFDNVSRFFQTS